MRLHVCMIFLKHSEKYFLSLENNRIWIWRKLNEKISKTLLKSSKKGHLLVNWKLETSLDENITHSERIKLYNINIHVVTMWYVDNKKKVFSNCPENCMEITLGEKGARNKSPEGTFVWKHVACKAYGNLVVNNWIFFFNNFWLGEASRIKLSLGYGNGHSRLKSTELFFLYLAYFSSYCEKTVI